MLRFFRKIRQGLLEKGKLQQYLFYAIGEIALVVLGILIALQINNWNEQRKNKQAENKALVDLKQEFETNFVILDFICQSKRKSETQLRAYFNLLTNDSLSTYQKSIRNRPAILGMTWNATHSVLAGLITSGEINHIKNDSLKNLLTNWPTLVHRWEKREDFMRDKDFLRLMEYEDRRLNINIPKADNREDWVAFYPNNTLSKLNKQRAQFVNDLEYQNMVARIIGILWIQSSFCDDLQNSYHQIVHYLNNELEARGIIE